MAKQAEVAGEGYGGLVIGPIDKAALSQEYKATAQAMNALLGTPLVEAECRGMRIGEPEPVSDKPKPVMPTFKRPWWLRKKFIDIQPLLWSIKHRPEEWELDNIGLLFTHRPSKHAVSVHSREFYGIHADTRCSCTGRGGAGYFSTWQKPAFHDAFQGWLRANYSKLTADARRRHNLNPHGHQLDAQFAEHFK